MKVKIYRGKGCAGWYPNVRSISFNKEGITIQNDDLSASTIVMTKKVKIKIKR